MADLSGRVALVTGGSRGVGRAACIKLAEAGADVAINYVSNSEAAEEVAAAVRALGRRAETYQADVGELEACEALASRALASFGAIDIFVSNAAVGATPLGRPVLTETNPADFRRLMEVNAFGAFDLCRLLVPQMRDRERGDADRGQLPGSLGHGFGRFRGRTGVGASGKEQGCGGKRAECCKTLLHRRPLVGEQG